MAVAHVGQRVLGGGAGPSVLWVRVAAMSLLAGSAGQEAFDSALPPRWRVAHGVLLIAALIVVGRALWQGARAAPPDRPGSRGTATEDRD